MTDQTSTDQSAEKWYYCLDHHAVEGRQGCKPSQRLGPYPSQAEAARALEKVRERNEAWDNDPDWNVEGIRE